MRRPTLLLTAAILTAGCPPRAVQLETTCPEPVVVAELPPLDMLTQAYLEAGSAFTEIEGHIFEAPPSSEEVEEVLQALERLAEVTEEAHRAAVRAGLEEDRTDSLRLSALALWTDLGRSRQAVLWGLRADVSQDALSIGAEDADAGLEAIRDVVEQALIGDGDQSPERRCRRLRLELFAAWLQHLGTVLQSLSGVEYDREMLIQEMGATAAPEIQQELDDLREEQSEVELDLPAARRGFELARDLDASLSELDRLADEIQRSESADPGGLELVLEATDELIEACAGR